MNCDAPSAVVINATLATAQSVTRLKHVKHAKLPLVAFHLPNVQVARLIAASATGVISQRPVLNATKYIYCLCNISYCTKCDKTETCEACETTSCCVPSAQCTSCKTDCCKRDGCDITETCSQCNTLYLLSMVCRHSFSMRYCRHYKGGVFCGERNSDTGCEEACDESNRKRTRENESGTTM